uniref:Uncharacterized protein n=1 Tax=Candidatus Kentrum sp. MB TaxID=2138164 RepID=A0A450X6Z0_9GAMM|nr:MAG: hypothetical protein BECKMB1821G_GA0114241_101122 [Candidatus Kentron sp. MB]
MKAASFCYGINNGEKKMMSFRSRITITIPINVVKDVEILRFVVVPSQLLVINSRNYHAVSDTKDRLACGSFISVMADNSLGLWS